MNELMIGWTTFSNKDDACRISTKLIESKLAACVHLEAPISAFYKWDNKMECDEEYRISVKFPKSNAESIKSWIQKNHPYDTPQWVACDIKDALEQYAKWACDSTEKDNK